MKQRFGSSPRRRRSSAETPPVAPPAAGSVPPEFADAQRGQRIQKVLAELGVASRRDCEALVLAGRVKVNHQLVAGLPAWVNPQTDFLQVDGVGVNRVAAPSRGRSPESPASGPRSRSAGIVPVKLYAMLYKPRRVISTARDDMGRRSVTDMVQVEGIHGAVRLFPVGRLDADSTGLILLTNDGELAHRLTHPSFGIPKQYLVSIKGLLTDQDIDKLKKGLLLVHRKEERQLARRHPRRPQSGSAPAEGTSPRPPIRATPADYQEVVVKRAAMERVQRLDRQVDRTQGDRTTLMVTLREGQNREIRRLLARLRFKVRRLHRVAIGPVQLKGVSSGKWRLLTPPEVRSLRRAVGLA